ncbi:hypothetical protein AHF37_12653 [Paragonimus kellicotti]|nr:hypothetical protein AHF37_12653 [Paragonimus kellicotti]
MASLDRSIILGRKPTYSTFRNSSSCQTGHPSFSCRTSACYIIMLIWSIQVNSLLKPLTTPILQSAFNVSKSK